MKEILSWIRGHKSSTAALVLVVAGCLALVLLARRVHHLRPRPAAAVATAATAVTGVSAASGVAAVPVPSGQAGTEHDARSAKMRSEFENGPHYLEFIQQAMSRPQEGGKFYALLAWKRCNDLGRHPGIAPAHAGDDSFHDAALGLVDDIGKRCTGVLEAYADVQALYQVVMEQRGGRDFLMPVNGRGIAAPSTRDTANPDIDAAIRTGDRWAQAEALENNADFLDAGNSAGDDATDRQLREWGAEVVACELVGNCRGGVQVSLHCVSTGDCTHDDYRDVVRAEVPDADRMVFDTTVEAMRQRMGLAPGEPDAEEASPR